MNTVAGKAGITASRSIGGKARARPLLMHPAVKPLVFIACLLPALWLVYGAVTNTLGANPAEALIRSTGDWTLRFLCIVLAVTPVRQWLNQPALARLRRMLGLFAFFYSCVHFLSYGWLDMGFVWPDIAKDIAKRPFILVGTAALLSMAPLAATSFNRAIKALGAARWRTLHKAVYATGLLGLLHFFWMRSAKHNYAEVAVYGAILAVLLGWRVVSAWKARR